jgi:hypothetical protein
VKDIKLVGKRINYEKSQVLFRYSPDENFLDYFKVMAGEWSYENGYLIGKENGNKGGILLYKEKFDFPVMLTFTASTVLPATRDVNAVFCANWDDEINDLGDSYVCGVGGWYDNKAGLERNEQGGTLAFRSLTSAYSYKPAKEITMTAGAIDGHTFMTVDGELVAEYIEYKNFLVSGYVGFSPYCTMLKIKDIEIRKIAYEEIDEKYDPEF